MGGRDHPEFNERDRGGAEHPHAKAQERQNDTSEPDRPDAQRDDGVNAADLPGVEFVEERKRTGGEGEEPRRQQEGPSRQYKRALHPPTRRPRPHRRHFTSDSGFR